MNKCTKKKEGDNYSYSIKDSSGQIQSKLKIYNFRLKDFDWDLMANVKTQYKYRRKGLATKLINKAYNDVKKNGKGLYLFVRKENDNAIKLYEKLNFYNIKTYSLKDGDYYIMAKGDSDMQQLKRMNFS